jgi:DNA-binding MarR family transcriptional regulator
VTGISAPRLSALSVVIFGGPLTLGRLAAAEQVKPPTMTRIVSGLEKDGLVERRSDRLDKRLTLIHPTARGRRTLAAGRTRRVETLTTAVNKLGPAELADLERGVQLVNELIVSMRFAPVG